MANKTEKSQNKREKRGLVNVVGTISKSLFGTLSDDDALQYLEEFEKLSRRRYTSKYDHTKANDFDPIWPIHTNEEVLPIINIDPSTKPKPLKPRPSLEQRIAIYQHMCTYAELIDDVKYRMSKKRRVQTSPSDQPSATSPDYQPAPKKYKWQKLNATPINEKMAEYRLLQSTSDTKM